jgi:catechol 2,3-dioxygenase-like lactoylglutathione lyase family enzyme
MIRIREIDHIVLRVVDLRRMLAFYCGVLGCTVERRDDSVGLVQLRAGRSLIDLVPVGGGAGQGRRRGGPDRGAQPRSFLCTRRAVRRNGHSQPPARARDCGRRVRDAKTVPRARAIVYISDRNRMSSSIKGQPDRLDTAGRG